MFERLKHYIIALFTIIFILSLCSDSKLRAQGMSRSHGLGFRFGLWKMARSSALISVSRSRVEVSGAGGWIYFFSRFQNDWFFEFNLGAIGSVISDDVSNDFGEIVVEEDDVTAIIPFLFGLRYDFLSLRNQSSLQPYSSFGAGLYWITSVNPHYNDENIKSGLTPGGYFGGGLNIALFSWFALNFDLKYHLVDFKINKDFSGLEFGIGVSIMWGRKREIIQIKEIKMIVNDIYPAYYQFYNFYPLAIVSIKNLTKSPVEVNIRSNVEFFSERPKDTGYIRIAGKETKDIPITAIFGPRIRRVAYRESTVLDLKIEAKGGSKITKEFSSPIIVHNPNSWNGEMDKLVFFVTSDDERILNFSRRLVGRLNLDNESSLRNFNTAKHIFNEFGQIGLRYHSDPNIPFYQDDRVQYAYETLKLKSGDCDDLVVLYASLLESVGINTAFVEVQDPQKELAHLYILFNSAVPYDQGHLISSNEKRYLIRESSVGNKTIWLPIETTLIDRGFEESWKAGALEYLQESKLRNGITEGWVRIIDVE
ncbi:MAG: hypothetical protein ACE5JB_14145 [bacterium]